MNTLTLNLKKIKPKTKIKYKVNEDNEWESAEITKRPAKALWQKPQEKAVIGGT